MSTIDIERLSTLLDRGADVQAAARQAREDLHDAEAAARKHEGDEASAAVLRARAERRRSAHAALETRASLWADYCNELRTVAKGHGGVEL